MLVEIYGCLSCLYCVRAKQLAEKMAIELADFEFKFIDMIAEGISKQDLAVRVGKAVDTVPQIFLDDQAVGGCTEFQQLVKQKFDIEL